MKYISLALAAFLLTGCAKFNVDETAVSKTTKEQIKVAKDFKYSTNQAVQTAWLKNFNDDTLIKLVDEALENNRELRSLKVKVDRANILIDKAASKMKPTVDLQGKYNSRDVFDQSEVQYGGLNVSWEFDVWGRLGLDKKSAQLNAEATRSDFEFARQYLVALTSKSWFTLITSKKQLDYSNKVVKLYEKELDIITRKLSVGQIDKKELYLAKSNLNKAKNANISSKNAFEDAQRSLELLLGRYPGALIKSNDDLLPIANTIPSGIPSDVLERRPDLVAAQQRVSSAFYKQKSAELLHLPRFDFTISASISNLADGVTDLIAGIFAPLYTGGAIEAEVEDATLAQKQTIEDYANLALKAFKEVETALSLEKRLLEQEQYLENIVQDNKKYLELTKVSNSVGKAQYLDVSEATEKLVSSEIELIDIKNKRLQNRINLHLALGGGFK